MHKVTNINDPTSRPTDGVVSIGHGKAAVEFLKEGGGNGDLRG